MVSSSGVPEPLSVLGWRDFPEARHLSLALIDPNPDQPRRHVKGIEELATHIRKHGLLQPIVVTPARNGRYTLIAGQRRLAAVRWLATHDDYRGRWLDIPAVIRTVDGAERLTLALAENVSRHALTDADLATAIQLLVDLHGWTQAEIARRLGVTPQWIGQYVLVLADAELAAFVQTGRLSVAIANQVRQAQTPETRRAALAAALEGAAFRAVRRLAAGADEAAAGEVGPATAGATVPHLPAVSPESVPNPSASAPVPPDSTAPSARPPFAARETGSHTLPVESHFPSAPPDAAPAGEQPLVSVRSLAVHALLQEARRQRRPAVPARDLHTALQHDLAAVAPTLLPA